MLRTAATGTTGTAQEDMRIVQLLPKVELHAHLHGSIRLSTLQELSGGDLTVNKLDLEECFRLFGAVHRIVSSIDIVKRVLQEVIDDYISENTIYLELRTTPRALADGTTVNQYIEQVVAAIQAHNINSGHIMTVKLILSIDRGQRYRDAQRVAELASSYFKNPTNSPTDPINPTNSPDTIKTQQNHSANSIKTIVGLDFSGNPLGGHFDSFRDLFEGARGAGLGITVHTAELYELSDSVDPVDGDETTSILDFGPDRLGHALHLKQHHLDKMLLLNSQGRAAAIEICPTSNQITLSLDSHSDHPHIRNWRAMGYPVSINTDDRGVFNTTLSEEIVHVKNVLQLDMSEVVELIASTISQTFASAEEKVLLSDRFWREVNKLIESETGGVFTPKKSIKHMHDMSYLITV